MLPDLSRALAGRIADGVGARVAAAAGCRRLALAAAPLLLLLLHGSAVSAPESIGGTPDAAYLASVRGLGVQAEIVYLPPTAVLDFGEAPPIPSPIPCRR